MLFMQEIYFCGTKLAIRGRLDRPQDSSPAVFFYKINLISTEFGRIDCHISQFGNPDQRHLFNYPYVAFIQTKVKQSVTSREKRVIIY